MRKGQSILEYAIVLGVVIFALSAMSLYFRRGIQAVVKIAADEAGNQKEAEDINPITGTTTASAINRQAQTTQTHKLSKDGSQYNMATNSSVEPIGLNEDGTPKFSYSSSVSTQEK